ncbi:Pentatricopeptide repeat [Dillenia turbinata]|uniref:Pentatricopeptide repeat n=1 Tax=Dillenia turbinata TaxID=194707 RepID=A0AAN8W8H1_9MAGN
MQGGCLIKCLKEVGFWELHDHRTVIITGLSGVLSVEDAWHLFGQMPDPDSVSCALTASADMTILSPSLQLYSQLIKRGFGSNSHVGNSAKSGSIINAEHVFMDFLNPDIVTWNSMIMGYGLLGFGREAINAFHQMQKAHIMPDRIRKCQKASELRRHAGKGSNEGVRIDREEYHRSVMPARSRNDALCLKSSPTTSILGKASHVTLSWRLGWRSWVLVVIKEKKFTLGPISYTDPGAAQLHCFTVPLDLSENNEVPLSCCPDLLLSVLSLTRENTVIVQQNSRSFQ